MSPGKISREVVVDRLSWIEEMIGGQIFLELNVRVQKDWTKDDKRLKELGYKQ